MKRPCQYCGFSLDGAGVVVCQGCGSPVCLGTLHEWCESMEVSVFVNRVSRDVEFARAAGQRPSPAHQLDLRFPSEGGSRPCDFVRKGFARAGAWRDGREARRVA